MILERCSICGTKGFSSHRQYEDHYKYQHHVTIESGMPRLDMSGILHTHKPYKPMLPELKQQIVEKMETYFRLSAWDKYQLNPLIGEDKTSVEPIWNKEREML